jgi:hypothetical protein
MRRSVIATLPNSSSASLARLMPARWITTSASVTASSNASLAKSSWLTGTTSNPPRARRRTLVCQPMKPAAPVTTTLGNRA